MPGLNSGRPRKPRALKILAGTDRPDRANPAAPQLEPGAIPPPPADLSENEQEAWRELRAIVEPLRVTTPADMVAFRQLAVTLALAEAARQAIRENGLTFTVVTDSGEVHRKRPEVEILLATKKQLSTELSRFGLTPADRERVSALTDDSADDPLDEFTVGH